MRKPIISLLFVLMLVMVAVSLTYAQAPPPASNPPGAPIDVLSILLVIGGAAAGAKKLRARKE